MIDRCFYKDKDGNVKEDFSMREGVFTEEKDNICCLPTIAKVIIHKSSETGKYYLNFIEWASGWNEGRWQDQEISESTARMILAYCYPEHIEEVMSKDLGKGVKA